MRTATQATPAPEMATPQTETTTNMQQPMNVPTAEPFMPPNFGLKVPKPRDLDWPGFAKFTGKEVYPGLGADFKTWGLRVLQRLAATQQMSGGDWSEEFRIIALNGKLDGTALTTTITAFKGLQLMTAEKLRERTWAEHFQYLTYVAERSGCPDLPVLQCLCNAWTTYSKLRS
ncbi:hypothetical protein PC111_g12699 [Phytophthora cactorum]|nr:hypothetical protein PC111_g12699 [Phytophthora cactorum]KAG2829681.1 hypothetical protein PC112_g8000 [Phytophthora cactorum]KAG2889570.1 hypothetical protein PC114_g17903 [Phytophthora cactorum]KAG3012838.1 hypothetical protein PC120_g13636 [Phytophthora cactorum]KAG3062737.1 hypothetical protein PC121_g12469 [Phytophthora cactorum]